MRPKVLSLPATAARICLSGRLLTRTASGAEHCEHMEVKMAPDETLPAKETPSIPEEGPDKGLLITGAIAGAVVLVVLLLVFFGAI